METKDPIESTLKKPKFEENIDRISNLPEPIIHHIFSFLETIDVIRSSAVSRKWRYLWVSLPYLNFDVETVWGEPIRSQGSTRILHEKFKDFVNWVFSTQNGSCDIQRFTLSCVNYPRDYAIYRWINIVARRNVKDLDLSLGSVTPFELPNCLLTCKSLEDLRLEFVRCECNILKLPSTAGFTNLKTLELENVELSDETVTRNFIANCPLLEDLIMMWCTYRDFRVLDISAVKLKRITLFPDVLRNCVLKLSCPNLVSFIYCGLLPQDLLLDNLPSLENAVFGIELGDDPVLDEELANKICKLLRGIQHTKVLILHLMLVEYLYPAVVKTRCLSTSFYNLNTLKVSIGMDECYLQSLLYLLDCCPSLEFLAIRFEMYRDCDDVWKLPDKAIACLTYHLKMVELTEVEDQENELELIRFFLMNGLVLEKMSVFWPLGLDQQRKTKTNKKVMRFPISSSCFTLTFSEQKPRTDD